MYLPIDISSIGEQPLRLHQPVPIGMFPLVRSYISVSSRFHYESLLSLLSPPPWCWNIPTFDILNLLFDSAKIAGDSKINDTACL